MSHLTNLSNLTNLSTSSPNAPEYSLVRSTQPVRNRPHKSAQRGQGLVEYALIILLVALAVIAGLTLLAPAIRGGLNGVLPAL